MQPSDPPPPHTHTHRPLHRPTHHNKPLLPCPAHSPAARASRVCPSGRPSRQMQSPAKPVLRGQGREHGVWPLAEGAAAEAKACCTRLAPTWANQAARLGTSYSCQHLQPMRGILPQRWETHLAGAGRQRHKACGHVHQARHHNGGVGGGVLPVVEVGQRKAAGVLGALGAVQIPAPRSRNWHGWQEAAAGLLSEAAPCRQLSGQLVAPQLQAGPWGAWPHLYAIGS